MGGGGSKEARGGLSIPLTRLSSPLLFTPLYGRTRSTGGQRWLAVDLSFFSPPYFLLFVLLTSPSPFLSSFISLLQNVTPAAIRETLMQESRLFWQ